MRAMRADGFRGYEDLKLADMPKPAVSEGRVLVKITAAGVTPLDHTILSGGYARAKAPLVLGSEGAGVIGRRERLRFFGRRSRYVHRVLRRVRRRGL
jgi:NADPH:quinone reductase